MSQISYLHVIWLEGSAWNLVNCLAFLKREGREAPALGPFERLRRVKKASAF